MSAITTAINGYFNKLFGKVKSMPSEGVLISSSTGGVDFARLNPIVKMLLVTDQPSLTQALAGTVAFIDVRDGKRYTKAGSVWSNSFYGGNLELLRPATLVLDSAGKGLYYCDNFMRYYKVNTSTANVIQ